MAFNDEIFEIFSWLPAKTILKFKSVSKFCNEFVSEKYFAQKESKNMLQKSDSTFFLQQDSAQKYRGILEFHALAGEEKSSGLPYESIDFLRKFGHMLSSSNGLICCRNTSGEPTDNGQLFICNPATRSWLAIPNPERFNNPNQELKVVFHCNMGPSYNEFPFDYFLMVLEHTEYWSSDLICKIYLPTQRVWQEMGLINFGARSILFESRVYHKGVLYFLSDWHPHVGKQSRFYWPYIVAFDPKNCTSMFLGIPKPIRKCDLLDPDFKMGMFKWDKGNHESICLVTLSKGVFTVWAISGINTSQSWRKILKVRTRAMRMVESNPQVAGFTVLNGDTLFIATEKRVYQYSLTGDWRWKKAKRVCSNKCGERIFFYPYSNTLRPCGNGATPISM